MLGAEELLLDHGSCSVWSCPEVWRLRLPRSIIGRGESPGNARIEHGHHGVEEVAAGTRAVVSEQHAVHADPRGPQLGDRSSLALADLRDAAAPFEIEVNVPISTQDAHGQWGRLPAVRADP